MNSWRMEKKEGVFSFIERKKWDLFFSSLIVRFFFVVGQSSECFVRWMKFVSLFSVSLSSV